MIIVAKPRTCDHCGDPHLCAPVPVKSRPRSTAFTPVAWERVGEFFTFLADDPAMRGWVRASHLYARYVDWCASEGHHPLSPKMLAAYMTGRGGLRRRSNGTLWDLRALQNPGDGTESGETID